MIGIRRILHFSAGIRQKESDSLNPYHDSFFSSIGFFVIFTSAFSFLSFSYCVFTFTNNYIISLITGLLLGLFSFFVERLSVSLLLTTAHSQFKVLIPRVLYSFVFTMCVGWHLTLVFFESDIDAVISSNNIMDQKNILLEYQSTLNYIHESYLSSLDDIEKRYYPSYIVDHIEKTENEMRACNKRADAMRRLHLEECAGMLTEATTGLRGAGPACMKTEVVYLDQKRKCTEVAEYFLQLEERLKEHQKMFDENLANTISSIEKRRNLLILNAKELKEKRLGYIFQQKQHSYLYRMQVFEVLLKTNTHVLIFVFLFLILVFMISITPVAISFSFGQNNNTLKKELFPVENNTLKVNENIVLDSVDKHYASTGQKIPYIIHIGRQIFEGNRVIGNNKGDIYTKSKFKRQWFNWLIVIIITGCFGSVLTLSLVWLISNKLNFLGPTIIYLVSGILTVLIVTPIGSWLFRTLVKQK